MVKGKSNEVLLAQRVMIKEMLYKTIKIMFGAWVAYYVVIQNFSL